MGQKINPVGLRLGINRGWDSLWYAKKKDFGNYLIEDFKIREYIKKNVINSGVSKVMIERTSNKCYVTIYTSRPGFVIEWAEKVYELGAGEILLTSMDGDGPPPPLVMLLLTSTQTLR